MDSALPDGSHITLKNQPPIARDAAGRVFQERRPLIQTTTRPVGHHGKSISDSCH